MTTAAYIRQITNGVLILVDEEPDSDATLSTGEYFALLFYTEHLTYLRNYKQYKGNSNYNENLEVYDMEVNMQGYEDGYYLSTDYHKVRDDLKGRVIIVTTTDITKCVLLD